MKPSARIGLEQPHLPEHRRSIEHAASKGIQPRSLHQYMAWFLEEWDAEMPSSLHSGGVWRSRKPDLDRNGDPVERVPSEHIGGSLLGSPQLNGAFRSLLESSPRQTNEDGDFVRPVHAAIAKMCGRGGWTDLHERALPNDHLQPAPFMARFLFRLAMTGDIVGTSDSMGIPRQIRDIYAEQALYRLWKAYEVAPGSMERVA